MGIVKMPMDERAYMTKEEAKKNRAKRKKKCRTEL